MQATTDTQAAGYRQIPARDLTTDHLVIDVHGGEHKIATVRRTTRNVFLTRADGWRDRFALDETVTVRGWVSLRTRQDYGQYRFAVYARGDQGETVSRNFPLSDAERYADHMAAQGYRVHVSLDTCG